jgi:hypothetical protein
MHCREAQPQTVPELQWGKNQRADAGDAVRQQSPLERSVMPPDRMVWIDEKVLIVNEDVRHYCYDGSKYQALLGETRRNFQQYQPRFSPSQVLLLLRATAVKPMTSPCAAPYIGNVWPRKLLSSSAVRKASVICLLESSVISTTEPYLFRYLPIHDIVKTPFANLTIERREPRQVSPSGHPPMTPGAVACDCLGGRVM